MNEHFFVESSLFIQRRFNRKTGRSHHGSINVHILKHKATLVLFASLITDKIGVLSISYFLMEGAFK